MSWSIVSQTFNSLSRDHFSNGSWIVALPSGRYFQLPLSGSRVADRVSHLLRHHPIFQLPLSGSPPAHRASSHTPQVLSTPSLGITAALKGTGLALMTAGFQLPLSGSHLIEYPRQPSNVSTAFNSLSRDHLLRVADEDQLARPPFNSLSRDHLPHPIQIAIEPDQLPFNSLSRDHAGLCGEVHPVLRDCIFQLPLSGSPAWPHLMKLSRVFAFNSLSRDHPLSHRPSRSARSSSFQLPLSGSLC